MRNKKNPWWKIILKVFGGFLSVILLYFVVVLIGCSITIKGEKKHSEDVTIYLLTNGVHSDVVVPVRNSYYDWSRRVKFSNTISKDSTFQYLAIGWGDKGFYMETPEWKDLKASVAFKAVTGLSSTAMHTTFYHEITKDEDSRKLVISAEQYKHLVEYLINGFKQDKDGNLIYIPTNAQYGNNDAFYEAKGSYSLIKTCNTWTNTALKKSGQDACLWTPFQQCIFSKYKQ